MGDVGLLGVGGDLRLDIRGVGLPGVGVVGLLDVEVVGLPGVGDFGLLGVGLPGVEGVWVPECESSLPCILRLHPLQPRPGWQKMS